MIAPTARAAVPARCECARPEPVMRDVLRCARCGLRTEAKR